MVLIFADEGFGGNQRHTDINTSVHSHDTINDIYCEIIIITTICFDDYHL